MTKLNVSANLDAPDDFYACLLAAHEGLGENEVHALNARLILILANHIGDQNVLEQAIETAKAASSSA